MGRRRFRPQGRAGQSANPNNYTWGMRAIFTGWTIGCAKACAAGQPIFQIERWHFGQSRQAELPKIPHPIAFVIPGGYMADHGISSPRASCPSWCRREMPTAMTGPGCAFRKFGATGHYTAGIPRSRDGAPPRSAVAGLLLPFPLTKADREKSGDPRLSIAERYPAVMLSRQGQGGGGQLIKALSAAEDEPRWWRMKPWSGTR